jgi:N-acetylmuramoyl-L-alanine amidase
MTTRNFSRWLLASALAVVSAACAPRAPGGAPPTPVPIPPPAEIARPPVPPGNPALPPVPHVTGPLEIKVVYPTAGQLIESKDSNFIFGSVGNGDAALTINGVPTPVWPNGAFMGWLPVPPPDLSRYDIVATTGSDTVRLAHLVKLQPAGPVTPAPGDTMQLLSPAQYAALVGPAIVSNDTDRVVTAYAPTGGIQRWFLIPGTIVKMVSTKGNDAFVQLDSSQTVRIARSDLNVLAPTYAPVALSTSAFRLVPGADWIDLAIPVSDRPAYLVEETDSSLTLTLYSVTGQPQTAVAPPSPAYVTSVASAASGPDMRYTISLRGPVYGYQPLWQNGLFTLRVRRPPPIDATDPLRGLTIAIDPGHPPVGATGPTGLWEPVPTLAVGLKVRDMLQARGVNVLMTRTTADPVDLNLRPTMARRANANALVSIHLNAIPDGMNPYRSEGTATYHYWMHSQPLASATQQALVAQLSLPDKGVRRENFALVRPTWMPAILCEGAFIIMPDQEAALQTPEYQERYARGIVDGLDRYFRSLGQAAH